MIISPTPGRVVWFYPSSTDEALQSFESVRAKEPLAAHVAKVWSDTCVNLMVIDPNGYTHSRTSVLLCQEEKVRPASGFAEWMPFQKGQARAAADVGTVGAQQPASDIESEIIAKGKTAPRVTPADLQANIESWWYFTAAQGVEGAAAAGTPFTEQPPVGAVSPLRLLTFCVLVLRNGFTVTGESACASPENFDAEIGRKIARQNAEQKIWPLMGYQLKEQLYQSTQPAVAPE